MAHHHCNGFRRAELIRRAAAEAGRGLPAVEQRHAAAGRDRAQPPLVPASLGRARADRLRRLEARRLGSAGGGRQGRRGRWAACSSRSSSRAASTRSPCSPRSATGATAATATTLALPEGSGAPFAEDNRLMWHPSAAALAQLHAEGKVSVLPAVGYTDPDQSHFTSRHYWEVGALQPHANTGWMGRFLDVTGTQDNPLQGLSLDGRLSPSIASAQRPRRRRRRPELRPLRARGLGRRRGPMFDSIARLGNAAQGSRPVAGQGRRRRRAGDAAARAALALRGGRGARHAGSLPGERGRGLPGVDGRPGGDARRRPAAPLRRPRGARATTTPTTPSRRTSPTT